MFECGSKLPNPTSFLYRSPVPSANYSEPQSHKSFVVNSGKEKQLFPWPRIGLAENDNATIHNSRFLRKVSVRTIVFQHSTGEQVSLYRPNSEIYVQENIFVVLFHHYCQIKCPIVKLSKGIKQLLYGNGRGNI